MTGDSQRGPKRFGLFGVMLSTSLPQWALLVYRVFPAGQPAPRVRVPGEARSASLHSIRSETRYPAGKHRDRKWQYRNARLQWLLRPESPRKNGWKWRYPARSWEIVLMPGYLPRAASLWKPSRWFPRRAPNTRLFLCSCAKSAQAV